MNCMTTPGDSDGPEPPNLGVSLVLSSSSEQHKDLKIQTNNAAERSSVPTPDNIKKEFTIAWNLNEDEETASSIHATKSSLWQKESSSTSRMSHKQHISRGDKVDELINTNISQLQSTKSIETVSMSNFKIPDVPSIYSVDSVESSMINNLDILEARDDERQQSSSACSENFKDSTHSSLEEILAGLTEEERELTAPKSAFGESTSFDTENDHDDSMVSTMETIISRKLQCNTFDTDISKQDSFCDVSLNSPSNDEESPLPLNEFLSSLPVVPLPTMKKKKKETLEDILMGLTEEERRLTDPDNRVKPGKSLAEEFVDDHYSMLKTSLWRLNLSYTRVGQHG